MRNQNNSEMKQAFIDLFELRLYSFSISHTYEAAEGADEVAEILVNEYGMTWSEVEELEIKITSKL